MKHTLLLVCAGAGLACALPAAAINKCVDANGRTTYQDARCAGDAIQGTLKIDPAPAAGPKPEASAPLATDEDKEDPRLLDLVATQGLYDNCLEVSPEFGERNAATYDAWRRANAELFARLERSPRYQAVLVRSRSQGRAQYQRVPGGSAKLAQFCEAQFVTALKNNTPH